MNRNDDRHNGSPPSASENIEIDLPPVRNSPCDSESQPYEYYCMYDKNNGGEWALVQANTLSGQYCEIDPSFKANEDPYQCLVPVENPQARGRGPSVTAATENQTSDDLRLPSGEPRHRHFVHYEYFEGTDGGNWYVVNGRCAHGRKQWLPSTLDAYLDTLDSNDQVRQKLEELRDLMKQVGTESFLTGLVLRPRPVQPDDASNQIVRPN